MFNLLLLFSDAKRALTLLERVQQKVNSNNGVDGNNSRSSLASQVQLDLDLLMNLLQNPVLKGILELEDSLVELDGHLASHPSLLPTDFDIDKTGQLVLNANIVPTLQTGKGSKGEKESLAVTKTSISSHQPSAISPQLGKKEMLQSSSIQPQLLQAAAKREIISIQVLAFL